MVIGTEAQAYEFTARMRKRGFSIFKIKTGSDMDSDFRRIAAVRRAAPKAEIYLDFNGAYDAPTAERFMAALKRTGVIPGVIEQPVARDDHDGLGYLSRKLKVPVCADESAYSVADWLGLLKKKQVRGVRMKLARFGRGRGSEGWALARAAGVKLMMGERLETELASMCAAQLAAGLGGFDFIGLDTPLLLKERVMRGGRYISPGGVYYPAAVKAGIGYVPR